MTRPLHPLAWRFLHGRKERMFAVKSSFRSSRMIKLIEELMLPREREKEKEGGLLGATEGEND